MCSVICLLEVLGIDKSRFIPSCTLLYQILESCEEDQDSAAQGVEEVEEVQEVEEVEEVEEVLPQELHLQVSRRSSQLVSWVEVVHGIPSCSG